MKRLLRTLRRTLGFAFALVLLFEQWGWEPLARLLARLGRLSFFAWLERRIARLPPYAALALFAAPAIALLPVKLAALWLVGRGHVASGLLVIVLAKLAGTAVVARLFVLTQPALMRLGWFARAYGRWVPWKNALLAQARASWPWRHARLVRRRARRWFGSVRAPR